VKEFIFLKIPSTCGFTKSPHFAAYLHSDRLFPGAATVIFSTVGDFIHNRVFTFIHCFPPFLNNMGKTLNTPCHAHLNFHAVFFIPLHSIYNAR